MIGVICFILVSLAAPIQGFNPLYPTDGYTYVIEANRESAWPSCEFRFLSYSESGSSVDLWNAAGFNQYWKLLDAGGGTFYLKNSYGKYLSYSGECDSHVVDLWSAAGVNQKFALVASDVSFEYYLVAVGRDQCTYKYVSFPVPCTTNSPDTVDLWSAAGPDQRFRIYPVGSDSPVVHSVGTSFVCPNPFVWKSVLSSEYNIQCTGGGLKLGLSVDLEPSSQFKYVGDCLGGTPAEWASYNTYDSRWAPENYETPSGASNFIFFSDTQPEDSKHRIGWALSTAGSPTPGSYSTYSPSYLNLGMASGGDIDSTIFTDSSTGNTYIIWKTDDNSVGSKTTRIWIQQLQITETNVSQVGEASVLLESSGLWWVDSWVEGGSLIEGPEMIQHNGYYYLFFAAGKFCEDTYTEGVARSSSLFGPYEKLKSPVLSNGIVGVAVDGNGAQQQLVGPGHATFAKNSNGDWRIIYHASIGQNCDRYSFINELKFDGNGWPYVNM